MKQHGQKKSSEGIELKAAIRTEFGKKVRELRRKGLVPAELFGRGVKNEHLTVSEKDFKKVYRAVGAHEIVRVKIEGGTTTPVLITDAAQDPISDRFLSVDFYAVRMDEKIRVKIPVVLAGEAPAAKKGLPIIKVQDEVEVEALPGNMPHEFVVDISVLDDLGKSIHARDLKTESDVKVLTDPDAVIATVGEKTKEEVVAPPPVAEAAPVAAAAEAASAPAEEK